VGVNIFAHPNRRQQQQKGAKFVRDKENINIQLNLDRITYTHDWLHRRQAQQLLPLD